MPMTARLHQGKTADRSMDEGGDAVRNHVRFVLGIVHSHSLHSSSDTRALPRGYCMYIAQTWDTSPHWIFRHTPHSPHYGDSSVSRLASSDSVVACRGGVAIT